MGFRWAGTGSPELCPNAYRLGDGGYNNRARFNFATRWRTQKMPGLNYGINVNVMKSRISTVFIWDNLDTGLYRPSPGTLTNTTGTQFYVDPFVSYTGPQSTRHSLKGRLYRQDFGNSNGKATATILSSRIPGSSAN
ncbi:MAG: hypothetical protein IPL86_11675 [Flavobacteriales bacterium]|nr:hypothetical protein [Flavobacteriales bacterium]